MKRVNVLLAVLLSGAYIAAWVVVLNFLVRTYGAHNVHKAPARGAMIVA